MKIRNNERLLLEGDVNFCYVDESGTGQEPIATMGGIVVDVGRMHLTKVDWTDLLSLLSGMTERTISELHTATFYSGNGVWRGLEGELRARVITQVLDWIAERKHRVVYTSVLKRSFFDARDAQEIPDELGSPWRFMRFHLAQAIQKYSQP